jgi:hypothetical protein
MFKPRLTLLFNRDYQRMGAAKKPREFPFGELAGSINLLFTIAARRPWLVLRLVDLADVVLGIQLDAELGYEIELLLEEVDVVLLVLHQLLE